MTTAGRVTVELVEDEVPVGEPAPDDDVPPLVGGVVPDVLPSRAAVVDSEGAVTVPSDEGDPLQPVATSRATTAADPAARARTARVVGRGGIPHCARGGGARPGARRSG
ncbi:hypothetical protein GCM10027517_24860 [Phycicoccus ginsengisoli]